MKKSFTLVFALAAGVSLLAGCSTSKPLVEPYMAPMESDYSLHKNWQVKLESMPNRDSEGLFFSEDDKSIYVATETGNLVSLIKSNTSRWSDQVQWESKFDSPIVAGPTLNNGRLLIGTSKGQLISVSAKSGEYLWQSQLSSEVMTRPLVADRKIFTRTVDGKLYALNAKTGKVIWVVEHQMPNLSLRGAPAPVYADGKLFIGWESGMVQALSAKSGALLWETRIAVPKGRTDLERIVDVQANLIIKNDRLFVLGYHGKFASINPESGNFYFVKELSGYRDFVVDDSSVYVVDEKDVLHAFDMFSGVSLWKQNAFKNRLVGDLSIAKEDILAVDGWGYLHWLNKTQGVEIARAKHSNEYGDGNRILRVFSEGNRIYLLDDEGVITSYDVTPSDLKLFKIEHEDTQAKAPVKEQPVTEQTQTDKQSGDDKTKNDESSKKDDSWWNFKLSDFWPF
ncbi:outer membrane protein assembly factor BamB [Thiomicrorhabdus sp. Milos-T2]|uniref:outer membrane protein assembly factor BamB n=1 Tax=Thiomicrorhabdus sp. Milos-T2 TaxID=90814 RepID=UPI000A02F243|nr:outer membrane protein assembly factor BamB [Thiomicrorhabdus sp. Milos-T2]